MKTTLLIAALALLVVACKKDQDQTQLLTDLVLFEVLSPAENDSFPLGSSVFVNASATAPFELHGYKIKVEKEADSIWGKFQHTHGNSMLVNEQIDGLSIGTYSCTVIVLADHAWQKLSLKRQIVVF